MVGDYLSAIEIPCGLRVGAATTATTLQTLIGVIERERPRFVVVGHGRPHTTRSRRSRIADEDLDYLEARARVRRGRLPAGAGRADRRPGARRGVGRPRRARSQCCARM